MELTIADGVAIRLGSRQLNRDRCALVPLPTFARRDSQTTGPASHQLKAPPESASAARISDWRWSPPNGRPGRQRRLAPPRQRAC